MSRWTGLANHIPEVSKKSRQVFSCHVVHFQSCWMQTVLSPTRWCCVLFNGVSHCLVNINWTKRTTWGSHIHRKSSIFKVVKVAFPSSTFTSCSLEKGISWGWLWRVHPLQDKNIYVKATYDPFCLLFVYCLIYLNTHIPIWVQNDSSPTPILTLHFFSFLVFQSPNSPIKLLIWLCYQYFL